jgi:hypothetical protein
MSNTKRKDYYVTVSDYYPDSKKWKATSDRKKWYKPTKKAKKGYVGKARLGRKADMKRAMMRPDEDGEIILPVEKKTDVWFYN